MYLYLSNDNAALGGNVIEVFFDDFTVEHIKSPVVQQDDYYAFGLNFNSYQRENATKNNYLYNGMEKQDELDLGWLDYGARMYDPTIARWMAIDPLTELSRRWSPYTYCYNSPLIFVDPDGMFADFYNEKGEHLGSDGVDDNKVYQTTNAAYDENVTNNSFASSNSGGPDYEGLKSSSDTHYLGETNDFGLIRLTGMGNDNIANYGNEDTYSYTDADGNTVAAGQHGDDWVTPEVGAAFNAAVNEFVAQPGNENIVVSVNDASAANPAKDLGHKTHFTGKSIDMPFIKADGSTSNSISSLTQADKTKTGDFTKILSDKGFSKNYSDNGAIPNTSHAAGHKDHLHVGKP